MPALSTPLDDVLGSKSKVRLLRLFAASTQPLSGREAGRRVGMAKRTVDLALRELNRSGILMREYTPAQSLYRINPEHILVKTAILPMFAAEQGSADALFDAVRVMIGKARQNAHAEIVWAGIYGSVARGDDDLESDLDLAIVTRTPDQSRALHDALGESQMSLMMRFGRRLSPLVLSVPQLKRLAAANDPLISALERESRRVSGAKTEIAEVIRGKA